MKMSIEGYCFRCGKHKLLGYLRAICTDCFLEMYEDIGKPGTPLSAPGSLPATSARS